MANIKIGEHEYELIANGYCYGYLPKIGDNGLLIIKSKYDGKWNFKNFPVIPEYGKNWEMWFQCWNGTDFEWFHGLVNQDGKIVQIG